MWHIVVPAKLYQRWNIYRSQWTRSLSSVWCALSFGGADAMSNNSSYAQSARNLINLICSLINSPVRLIPVVGVTPGAHYRTSIQELLHLRNQLPPLLVLSCTILGRWILDATTLKSWPLHSIRFNARAPLALCGGRGNGGNSLRSTQTNEVRKNRLIRCLISARPRTIAPAR